MFFSARCIAAKRLAFSLVNDSMHALNSETKRCGCGDHMILRKRAQRGAAATWEDKV
jgi:hypothetical protein